MSRGIMRKHYREHRFLRSDHRPDFSHIIREREGEIAMIASKPVVTARKTTPIINGVKTMFERGFRRLPIVDSRMRLCGIVTAMDIINYFGGGNYYKIITEKHNGSFYSALYEPMESIMTKDVVSAYIGERISSVLEKMAKNNVGGVPVITKDGRVYGIVTERDILNHISDVRIDRKISEIMTRNVITISQDATIIDAECLMIKFGFRRLPVVEGGKVVGIIVAMDIIRYFGSKEVFNYIVEGKIQEVLSVKVSKIMAQDLVIINPKSTITDAVKLMNKKNVGALLVTKRGKLEGIVTEKDIVYALAFE